MMYNVKYEINMYHQITRLWYLPSHHDSALGDNKICSEMWSDDNLRRLLASLVPQLVWLVSTQTLITINIDIYCTINNILITEKQETNLYEYS
jgi:hypothetical protein